MKTKIIKFYEDRQLKGIRWAAKNVTFGVSLTVASAFNELYTAHMMLRDRKDLFRNEVKRFTNEAEARARRKRLQMLDIIANRQFFDTYSDRVIDLAERDMAIFRIGLKQTMDDASYPDSELISYVETAHVMLKSAALHFSEVMRAAREKFGSYEYEDAFCEFNVSEVEKSWSRVCRLLYGNVLDIDLNTPRNKQAFRIISDSFAQGKYVDECLAEARAEQPEWVDRNLLIVEEG